MTDVIGLDGFLEEIVIERTPEFFKSAQELSDFIIRLDLPASQNNELVRLITKNVNDAEHGAALFGFNLGVRIAPKILEDEGRNLK